jgi:(2Fe-2S) ferredoxin
MVDEKKYRVYLCGGSSCTANGRDALLKILEDELWAWQIDGDVDVRVSSCQDRCDFSPNLKIWPGPYNYSRLNADAIKRIVEQHLLKDQPISELLSGEDERRKP